MAALILADNFEQSLVLGTRADFTGSVRARTGELWMRLENEPDSLPIKIADVSAGETVSVPYNPAYDGGIRLYLVSYGADGAPLSKTIDRAAQKIVFLNRETGAPVIGQTSAATNTTVGVGVSNYSDAARFRKIEIAETNNMSGAAVEILNAADFNNNQLPTMFTVSRSAASANLTRFVRVSHSSNNAAYGAPSNILEIVFADAGGGGGSGGDYNPNRNPDVILNY